MNLRWKQPHFMAGNLYEGCTHFHKTFDTAAKCAKKYPKFKVWRIWYEGNKRRWQKVGGK